MHSYANRSQIRALLRAVRPAGPQVCKDLDNEYMELYLKAHQMATDGTTVRNELRANCAQTAHRVRTNCPLSGLTGRDPRLR